MVSQNRRIRKLLDRAEDLGPDEPEGPVFDFSDFSSEELARSRWLMKRSRHGGYPPPAEGLARIDPSRSERRYILDRAQRDPAYALGEAADEILPEPFVRDELGLNTGPLTGEEREELVGYLIRAGWEPDD